MSRNIAESSKKNKQFSVFITYCRSRVFHGTLFREKTEVCRENCRIFHRSESGGSRRSPVRAVQLLPDRGSRNLRIRGRGKPGQKHAVSDPGNGYRESRSRGKSGCRGYRPHRAEVRGDPEGRGRPHPSGSLGQYPGCRTDVQGRKPDRGLTVSLGAVRTSVPCRGTGPGGPLRCIDRRPLSWPCSGRRTFSRTWA